METRQDLKKEEVQGMNTFEIIFPTLLKKLKTGSLKGNFSFHKIHTSACAYVWNEWGGKIMKRRRRKWKKAYVLLSFQFLRRTPCRADKNVSCSDWMNCWDLKLLQRIFMNFRFLRIGNAERSMKQSRKDVACTNFWYTKGHIRTTLNEKSEKGRKKGIYGNAIEASLLYL